MRGTFVNAGAIIFGAIIGTLLKNGIPKRISDSLLKVEGLAIGIIGLNGVITAMFSVNPETGRLSDAGGFLLLISLIVGCLAGELLRFDDGINRFGRFVEKKLENNFAAFTNTGVAQGFITATLVFSIGAMSIIGPLNDGLTGDSSILFIKAALDGITSVVLASTLGGGVVFSALSVFVVQGSIALLSKAISPYMTDDLLRMICMVGYAIVLVIGINFLCNTKVKTANLIPSLIIPVIYYVFFQK